LAYRYNSKDCTLQVGWDSDLPVRVDRFDGGVATAEESNEQVIGSLYACVSNLWGDAYDGLYPR
jgi:hypothetical protein